MTVTPEGYSCLFRHNVYTLLNQVPTKMTVVQYLGDETVATPFSHGNSRISYKPHTRTCPSVLKAMSSSDEVPSNTYKKAVTTTECGADLQPVLLHRNIKQVSSLQGRDKQKCRLTHDAL